MVRNNLREVIGLLTNRHSSSQDMIDLFYIVLLTASDFAGEDSWYLQNRIQEFTDRWHHETGRAGHGKLVLRPKH